MLSAIGVLLFLTSFAIASGVLPWLERGARRGGLLDRPGGRKEHAAAVPLTGGIAVLLAVALPCAAGVLVAVLRGALGSTLPEAVALHLPGVVAKADELGAILLGSGILLVLGHLDDRRGLSTALRLLVEAGCALALALVGVRVTLYLPEPWMHVLVTVLFVVFVTNAVNFIDNMNGLLAGATLLMSLHLLTLAIATGQLFLAALLLCLAGGLAAFLPRNFPEARAFMGDAGSLAIGFLLAALTVSFTFEQDGPSPRPVLLPLLVLALPLADGVLVVLTRLARGIHPFTAGRDHLSHRLVALGLRPRDAVLALWVGAFASGVPVWVLGGVPARLVALVWLPAAAFLAAAFLMAKRPS